MASICHLSTQWWPHFHPQQPLTMQHYHGYNAISYYHTPISLFLSISCPSLPSKTYFIKMCGPSCLSLLNWGIIFCLENHCWVYTFRKIISLSLCYMFCLKHARYAFWILIKFLIYIVHFFLPKAGFLTGLLGKQKHNLRKYHSNLSL